MCGIHPDFTARGVAKKILLKLETLALKENISCLNTCSTSNALGFYRNYGYIETEKSFHLLPDMTKLECIKVYKKLKLV